MKIGVLKEIKENEYRVSAVPATVQEITRHGHTVYVEAGAGVGSGFSDAEYEAAGAMIADADTVWRESDIYYKVKELFPQEFKWMKKDKILFTYIHSNAHPAETDCLLDSHVSAVAYEDVPDKNGRFPLLRPMSELAGKGGFLAQIAPAHPDINYLGIDITDKVLILAKRKVEAAYAARGIPADNVKIASLDIERLGNAFTPEDRVSRIYINFCNPWSKNAGSNKHRLTHPRQLLQYRQLMDEGAEIWFKTDDDDLFRDSLSYFPAAGFEITWQTFDLHKNEPDWNLRTEHEGMFSEQGIPIKALIARKGPDSTVTWVEPKALAKQQEAEDDAD